MRTEGAAAIDALIVAVLRHQFARPRLAPVSEALEETPGLGAEEAALAEALSAEGLAANRRRWHEAGPVEAREVTAIAEGIVNAAALAGEPDAEAVGARVRRAVLGYLGRSGGLAPFPVQKADDVEHDPV